MSFSKQSLTFYSNPSVNALLKKVLHEAKSVFEELFTQKQTAALILIGGYGRGEGGIVKEDDSYRPHNNLDLLYIYNDKIDKKTVALANSRLQKISEMYHIGIDMSAIKKEKLLTLNGLVISYDMRYGHKTLLGDSTFLKEHKAFSVYSIDAADIRQLMVNRGTLLLINRLLFTKENLSKEEKKLIIKHSIKSIIGYGDALLYFNGGYHWSYAQKQINMSKAKNISNKIKKLYDDAILFRFMPDYEAYLEKDLKAWNEMLIETFKDMHLQCESMHLIQPQIAWDTYVHNALENKSYPRQNIKQKIKSGLYGMRNFAACKTFGLSSETISFMQIGGKGMLSLLFPYIMYNIKSTPYKALLQSILHTKNTDEDTLLKQFLLEWAKWGDTNFINVLRTYNIELKGNA